MTELDDLLSSSLRRVASTYVPAHSGRAQAEALRRHGRRRLLFGAGAAAAACLILAGVFVLATRRDTTTDLPFQGIPPAPLGRVVVLDSFDLALSPTDVEVTDDALVLADSDGRISLFDTETREMRHLQDILVSDSRLRIDLGEGDVFAVNGVTGTLERYELDQGVPARSTNVGATPFDLVYGEGFVWVVSSAPEGPADQYVVTKFDASTLERLGSFEVPSIAHLEFGYGWLWVGTTEGVLRVDPQTDARTPVRGVDSVSDLSAGTGAVWVYENPARGMRASVAQVDPEDAVVTERVGVSGFFGEVEADPDNGIWVLSNTTETARVLSRIDPSSTRLMEGELQFEGGVMEMTSGLGSLWLVDESQQTLQRIGADAER